MKLVVGNFKMNLNSIEIDEYISFFKGNNYSNVIFAPSFIYLERFINNDLKVASQDIAFEEKGAFTGDISASQLKSIGVNYTIIGHSERRKYYDDSKYVNENLNRDYNLRLMEMTIKEIFENFPLNNTYSEIIKAKNYNKVLAKDIFEKNQEKKVIEILNSKYIDYLERYSGLYEKKQQDQLLKKYYEYDYISIEKGDSPDSKYKKLMKFHKLLQNGINLCDSKIKDLETKVK